MNKKNTTLNAWNRMMCLCTHKHGGTPPPLLRFLFTQPATAALVSLRSGCVQIVETGPDNEVNEDRSPLTATTTRMLNEKRRKDSTRDGTELDF